MGAQALCLQLIPYGEKAVLKHGQTTDGQLTPSRDRCKWDNHSEGQCWLGSEQGPSAWAVAFAMGLPVHCRASVSSLASTSGTLHSVSTRCQMPPEEHYHLWLRSTGLQCVIFLSHVLDLQSSPGERPPGPEMLGSTSHPGWPEVVWGRGRSSGLFVQCSLS